MKLVQIVLLTYLGISIGQDLDKINRFNDILAGFGFSGASHFGTQDDPQDPNTQNTNRRPSQPIALASSQSTRLPPSQPVGLGSRPPSRRPKQPAALANLLAVAEEPKNDPRPLPSASRSKGKATSRFDELVAGFGFGRADKGPGPRSQPEVRSQSGPRSQPDLRSQPGPRSQPAQNINRRQQESFNQPISSGREFTLASTSGILGHVDSPRSQRPSPTPPRPTKSPKRPRPPPTQARRPPRPSPIPALLPSRTQPPTTSRSQKKISKSRNKSSALANLFNLVTENKLEIAPSRPQKPRPTPTIPQKPRPTPTIPQKPRPTPTIPQKPRPTPTRPQKPRPTPTIPQKPRHTPTRPQKPRPTPTRPQKQASSFDFERDFDSFGSRITSSKLNAKQQNKQASNEGRRGQPNSRSRTGGRRQPPETRQSIEAKRGPTNRPQVKSQNVRTSKPIAEVNRFNEIDIGVSRQSPQKQTSALSSNQKEQQSRFEAALESIRQRPSLQSLPQKVNDIPDKRGRNTPKIQPVNRAKGSFQGQSARGSSRPSQFGQKSPLKILQSVVDGQRSQRPGKQETSIQSIFNNRPGSGNRQGSQFSLQSTHAILGTRNQEPVSVPGRLREATNSKLVTPSVSEESFGLRNLLKVAGNPRRKPAVQNIQPTTIPSVFRPGNKGRNPNLSSRAEGNNRGGLSNLLNIAGDPRQNPVAEETAGPAPVISSLFNRGPGNEDRRTNASPKVEVNNRPKGRGSSDPTLNNLLSIAEGNGPTLVVNSRSRSRAKGRRPPISEETSIRQGTPRPQSPKRLPPATRQPFIVQNSFITKSPVSLKNLAKKVNENNVGRDASLGLDLERQQQDRATPKLLRVNQKQRTNTISNSRQNDDRKETASRARPQSTSLSQSQQKQRSQDSSTREDASSISLKDNLLQDAIRPDNFEERPRSSSLDRNRQNDIEDNDRRQSEKNDRRTDLPIRSNESHDDRRQRPKKNKKKSNRFDYEYDEDYEYEDRRQQQRPKKNKKKNKKKTKLRPPISPTCLRVCETLIYEVYQLLGGTLCDCN